MSELIFPLLDELTQNHFNEAIKHENEVIRLRCEELGIPIPSIELRADYRFNPFMQIADHNFNRYLYFNDGTKGGTFIVGFVTHQEYHPTKLDISMYTTVVTEEPLHLKL